MFYPYEENEINYKDSVYGTVIGCCKNGILIRLENDDVAVKQNFEQFAFIQAVAYIEYARLYANSL